MDGIQPEPNGANYHARVEDAPEDGAGGHSEMPNNNIINNAEDVPPAAPLSMSLTFRDQTDFALTFKLKATTRLGKAMNHFSAKAEKAPNTLRFLFEGDRINADSTPADVGLEDGDVVEVHMEQIGGGNV
ncbi:SUMO protein smt3 [Recurvomyces mirabilis]|uniref:SUMO protein smt3 n=1 Tax=Recurvomyces mirabilis TaxID=574656 RepID=A0AAE0TML9_9PEZI|nr:SUMO protein smt3 [Recurvomyces mirabilis]KAK5149708.1 hypothetical protein LTS14_010706 [Recurvomyces mirabilis]